MVHEELKTLHTRHTWIWQFYFQNDISRLLTVAFGNVIVIIIAKLKAFDSQASEFFMFGAFMYLDMLVSAKHHF